MKYVRIFLKILLGLIALILLFAVANIVPVDNTPYQQTDFYKETGNRLAALTRPRAGTGSNPGGMGPREPDSFVYNADGRLRSTARKTLD